MTRISGVNPSFGDNLYAKRQVGDNSEIYISSRLSRLSQQTIADCFVRSKLGSIRNFVTFKDKEGA